MSSQRKVTTPYAQYVFTNVAQFARVGQGMYSYAELASGVGLKPTQHFRRRVNQMVKDGVLRLCPAFTPRGGIENRFMIDITESEAAWQHPL